MRSVAVRLPRRAASPAIVLVLAVAGIGVISPAAADPVPTGSMSGRVVGPDGVGIPNVAVDANGERTGYYGYTYTGPSGEFVIPRLPPDRYWVTYAADGYVSEFYNDADFNGATLIGPREGGTPLGTAMLAVAAPSVTPDADTDVTGVIADAATGKPIFGIDVEAYDAATGNHLDSATTDTAGRYDLDGLESVVAVKLEFADGSAGGADYSYITSWSGGAKTMPGAAAVPVTPGAAVDYPVKLVRSGGLSGRILNPAGHVPVGANVDVYDMDGAQVARSGSIRGDGGYSVSGLTPGQSYKVRFTSGYDFAGNDDDNARHYYLDVWYGGNDYASATTVVAGTAGIDGTLQDTLAAFEAPAVTGNYVIGQTLTGSVGRWNKSADSTFKLEWLRGTAVVGTAATYPLTAADAGKAIALRITNTNVDRRTGEARTASVTTTPVVAKFRAKVSGSTRKVKGRTQVNIKVSAAGQPAARTTGTVKVTAGKKKVATVKVRKGKARFVLKPAFAKPGKRSFTLTYGGSATTLAAKGKVTVRIRK